MDHQTITNDEQEVFVFPASFAQRRLWFLNQLEPGDPSYNVPTVLRLEGPLNVVALQQALDEVVRRHEVLRTTFALVNDEPVQVIHPEAHVAIQTIDLRHLPAPERWDDAMRRVAEDAWQTFNLEQGPLLRALLLQLDDDDHVSMLTMHHIISDAWSKMVLVEEISKLYEAYQQNQAAPLAELVVQYADFAEWQQQWLTGEVLENQLSYWRGHLDGAPSALRLPTDRPRPPVQTHRGATQAIHLPPSLTQALKDLSRREDATLFMTLLAGFKALLYRYTAQTDIVVGTPIAGRNQAETEKLIGFFVNTLVLRTDLSGEPDFSQLVRRVREVALGAYAHQELPFEKLVQELQPERSLSYAPLFQVVFAFQSATSQSPSLPGIRLSVPYIENTTAKFDLTLLATETEAGINCSLEYNTDLFDAATITRMLDHLRRLFEAAVANPSRPLGDLPLLSDAEQYQLLTEWNSTTTDYPRDACVHELFEAQVASAPEATALVYEDETLTYRQLNDRANQLAHRLRALGVGPEETVGVLMERSSELIIAMLATLKAGGAYVPLSPSYPPERLALMCDDAQVRVLLTQERFVRLAPEHCGELLVLDAGAANLTEAESRNLNLVMTSRNRAYVMYTSGSTGRPKGVNIEHRGIVRLVKETNFADFSSAETFLQFAPITFDASTLEIWGSLLNGGRLVVMASGAASPEELGETLRRHHVNSLWLTAGLFHLMVDENLEGLRFVRQLLAGGDVLSPTHIARVLRELPECHVINGYGPTENTTFICCHLMRAGEQLGPPVPIGRPISNTRVYLVSPRLQLVPVGVAGELLAAGDGLARDYLGDPELTAERFIPDPFSALPGGRLYRTGDLARYRADGVIEFLGRVDQQVKIRGFRIEPEEIEVVLQRHPGVRRVTVQVHQDATGEKHLIAYVAQDAERELTSDELREYLAHKLPDYMMPAAFVVMDELPLTAHGKVDRSRLPALSEWAGNNGPEYVAPNTPLEELLCNIFADVLRLERIGVTDNFFHLGGHSLSATRVMSRVKAAVGPVAGLRDLFEAPTPALLAQRIEQAQQTPNVLPLRAIERAGALPLSFAQQRLWFFDQLEPGSASYNIPIALRISGPLNVGALESSLARVVQRHEALRTSFSIVDGSSVQVVHELGEWHLPLLELSGMPEPEREAEMLMKQEAVRPFDLQTGPLFRAALLRFAAGDHLLLLTMHHIISDGWSMSVLVREAATLYQASIEGREAELPELVVQYADFAQWQRKWLTGEVLAEQLSYWRQQLGNAPAELELPADRARPAQPTYKGAMETLAFPQELTELLKTFSRREGATIFMVLLAGFKALLHRYTGQLDIVVGTPVAGRNHAEIEHLIGFFVNTLALRTDMSGNPTFRELLKRVREVALGAYAHQDLPFERLVEELRPERHLGRAPLIRVMFVLQNTPQEVLELPQLSLTWLPTAKSMAEFDWVLNAQETERELFLSFEYNTDFFEAATIRRLLDQFKILVAGALAQPDTSISELPLLTEREKNQLLFEFDRSGIGPRGRTLHGLFAEQVKRNPGSIAISFGGEQITYKALDERSNQIAHGLTKLGMRPGQPVAVMLDSGVQQIATLLGVLKAGCHFVCLDTRYPVVRLQQMLAEVGPPCLIMSESHLGSHAELLAELREQTACRLIVLEQEAAFANGPRTTPDVDVKPDDLAYIVYTSGSTGRPKGIMQTHLAFCQYVEWQGRQFDIGPGKRIAQWASITYDASYAEIFGALCFGATLCMTDALVRGEAEALSAWLQDDRISLLITVPSFARQILQTLQTKQSELPHFEALLLAGEALPVSLAEAWLRQFPQGPRLFNLYGPTESVLATYHHVTEASLARRSIPVGTAIDGRHILIVDEYGKLAPLGGTGEIYLRSPYLSLGYVSQPEQTARAFVQNPLQNEYPELVYRTGDLGRWMSDGTIELLGRKDNQVKIRGMRVELEEIEAALLRHEAVVECVVAAHDYDETDRRICAYVVANEDCGSFALYSFLKKSLPDYMVPGVFIFLPDLPRLPNGKVDRHALPAPDVHRPEIATPFAEPESETELTVAGLWKELLRLEKVGRHDNFFDLGGHSLLATQVVNKLRNLCAVDLPLHAFFEDPTVAALASRIEEARRQQGDFDSLTQILEQVKQMSDDEVTALLAQQSV